MCGTEAREQRRPAAESGCCRGCSWAIGNHGVGGDAAVILKTVLAGQEGEGPQEHRNLPVHKPELLCNRSSQAIPQPSGAMAGVDVGYSI